MREVRYIDPFQFNHVRSFTDNGREREIIKLDVHHPSRTFRRTPPVFIDDYRNTGIAAHLSNPADISMDDIYVSRVHDAVVVGYKSAVTMEGGVLTDTRVDFLNEGNSVMDRLCDVSDELNHQCTGFYKEGHRYFSIRVDHPDFRIEEPVFILSSTEPTNFGSWLFRILPKLITYRKLGLDCKIFCYCPRQWQIDLLVACGIPEERIICQDINKAYYFSQLYVPSLRNSQAYLDQETLDFYSDFCQQNGVVKNPHRMIYISRSKFSESKPDSRFFMNGDDFTNRLVQLGFEVIYPETLSIIEQAQTFASAKLVVTPSGSAMFSSVFSPPETMFIDIESFSHWFHAHTNLFASQGHPYGIIMGEADESDPSPVHKRWSLDVDMAISRIDQVMKLL